METPLETRLQELLEPLVRSEGLILVELQLRRENQGQVLRMYVDRPQGGITLDECALISRQSSDLLDVDDLIPGRYRLEVSSPGLTRRLRRPREYELFAGRLAKLVVHEPDGGTETVRGRLKGLMGQDVLIESQGRVRALAMDQVAKATLEPEI